MRISAEARERTRARIVAEARRLFCEQGFSRTATRDLARAAGIGTGTLFNYFPSKEELALHLVAEAVERGEEGYRRRRRGTEGLREELFAHVAAQLRELAPLRPFVGEVLESALSPFARNAVTEAGDRLRAAHLETVESVIADHGAGERAGYVAVHLYWTLYLGVLAFWTRDASPHQQDTLVVLDRSMQLFVDSLRVESVESEVSRGR